MPERRFPPPWSVEDIGAAFVVKDSTGQQLAYVYYEEEPGRGFKKHFRKLMRSPCSRKSELPRLHFDGDQPPSPQLSPSSSSVGAFSNYCPPLPPPWSVEDIGAAFVVKDSNGFAFGLASYVFAPRRLKGCLAPPTLRLRRWHTIH
jgi:hypothetical protein